MNQETLLKLGKGIAQSIKKTKGKDIALIASSDMTHYEPKNEENPKKEIHDNQYKKDENVIKAFINFDWKKVFETASETSVCGPQTIFTLMIVANELGYKKPRKLGYYTSYEKLGDKGPSNYSVGYFSGIIEKD